MVYTTLPTPYGQTLAYQHFQGDTTQPGWIFLGGFRSDMQGTKAQFLLQLAQQHNRSCVVFDYTGHGQSSGTFEAGVLSDWLRDAAFILDALTKGPQVLIGSSMGGWLMFLLAKQAPQRLKGLIGIACAPDFTQELLEQKLTTQERQILQQEGQIQVQSGPFSHPISQSLLEDGKQHHILNQQFHVDVPVHLLHGTHDEEVPYPYSKRLLEKVQAPFAALHLIQRGDHRLHDPEHLSFLKTLVLNVAGGF